jgi:predicted NUDIX family NTP pyrophosphohydrolase
MKQSAGTLLYREGPDGVEVLLVHGSGWYNQKKPWGIPKGLPDAGETDLETTARRETLEETGVTVSGPLTPLGDTTYTKSRKKIYCFAGPAPAEARPRCASWEVDHAEFVPLERARELMHPDQRVFLDRLEAHLARAAADQPASASRPRRPDR